jgi:hypothetical protein
MGAPVKIVMLQPGEIGFEPSNLGDALMHASLLGTGDVVSERRALARAEGRSNLTARKPKGTR